MKTTNFKTKLHLFKTSSQIISKIPLIFMFLVIMQFPFLGVFSQNPENGSLVVSGTVTDVSGAALPGVTVAVKGTKLGAITDLKGNYSIRNLNAKSTLQFSFVGMESVEVVVGDKKIQNVVLHESSFIINEVVAVGYGSQSKRKITGAVSSIKSDALNSVPTNNPIQSLQGQASGVTVINSGSPGSAPTIRVRGIGTLGDNNPAYIVDGFLTNDISSLNPNDIESISVLKDASTAAVYGSLGANGVLVITTKKGKEGKVSFSFDNYVGIQFKPQTLDLLNSDQYVEYAKEMQTNAGLAIPTRLTDPAYSDYIKNNTDWQNTILQNGMTSNYNLSVTGGGDNGVFRLSAGYMNQEGVLVKTNYNKFNLRTNSEFRLGKFSVGENISISLSNYNPLIEANARSPFENAIKMAPYIPVYDTQNLGGFRGPDAIDGQDARNPLRTLMLEDQQTNSTSIIGNIWGKAEIFKGLTYNFSVGLDYKNSLANRFAAPFYDGTLHSQTSSIIEKSVFNTSSILASNSLNYKKVLAEEHFIDILLVAENQKMTANSLRGSGSSALSNSFDQLINGVSNSRLDEYARIGYLMRANYDYQGKYLLAFSVRRDGSSRFGANNRWGNFPSLAAGWNVSDEKFWLKNNFINNMKLRASWGVAGNDKIGNYGYSSTLSPTFNYGLTTTGVAASNLPNPDLKWEATTMQNIGLDMGFFDNSLTLSVEYYNNNSNDLLIGVPPAASVGVLETTYRNIGGMKTSGFEFNSGFNKTNGDLQYGVNLNLSTTTNVVTKLSPSIDTYTGGTYYGGGEISRIILGQELWHFYGYQTDGIFQNQTEITNAAFQPNVKPGDIRFKDLNGDNVIDAKDRTNIGNPFPKVTYGLSTNVSYKGVDMSVLFSGVSGNKIFNVNRFFLDGSDKIYNAGTAVLARWKGEGTSTTVPRIVTGDPNKNTRISDRYVEDGSYLRLRNLSIGYKFSNSFLKAYSSGVISNLRVYVSGQNLLTFTKYSGYDPEIGSSNGQNVELGIDRGMYPQAKSVIAGLQITL